MDSITSSSIETFKSEVSFGVPKTVTLSWKSITVKASTGGPLVNFFSKLNNNSKSIKTILKNVSGVVEPGKMLALIGSRYE